MAVAYGIGGLFQGFTEGMEAARKDKDAEDRRMLMEKQGKEMDLKIAQQQRDADYQNEIKALYEDASRQAQPGLTGQAVDESGNPMGIQTFRGQGRPEEHGISFVGTPQQVAPRNTLTDPGYAEDLLRREQEIQRRYNKITAIDAMKAMSTFQKMKEEGALDAGRYYLNTGDAEGAKQMFSGKGGVKFPEGATFEKTQAPIFPGVKDSPMMSSFVVKDQNGNQIFDWGTALRSSMDPKEVLKHDTELGKAILDKAWRDASIDQQREYHSGLLKIEQQKADDSAQAHRDNAEIRRLQVETLMENLGITRDAKKADALRKMYESGQKEIYRASGYNPNTKAADLVIPADKARHAASMNLGNLAESIWQGNISPNGLTAGASTSDAVQLANQFLGKDGVEFTKKNVKQDETGVFVNYNGKKIYVPYSLYQEVAGSEKTQGAKAVEKGGPKQQGTSGPVKPWTTGIWSLRSNPDGPPSFGISAPAGAYDQEMADRSN